MNRRDALRSLGQIAALTALPTVDAKELTAIPSDTQLSADHLPKPAQANNFRVLTDEADRRALGAIFDRLIPADEYGPSATQAGALIFIDDQLAGDYGAGKALYLEKPLNPENEEAIMGSPQFLATPKERYISGLRALKSYTKTTYNKAPEALSDEQMDALLTQMEAGEITLPDNVHAAAFFELLLQNVRESYLADPIYGGNKDMVGWKMVGFPGARYDYRKYVTHHNEDLALIPVSLIPVSQ
ncbi:gluconate 2-dehydrogenase subunit 3 family protein [Salinimonas lutimaris]|uniref:gluconate 2-dehydrogenase subunit 3 family protein n=1 Tax=Salinimonas lutimaris TaxID=914153 RepID=UPI0010BFC7CA|nr:gluconate 2-dehydrogenase subunit 3 family protein [Salinimonas lutimaris]